MATHPLPGAHRSANATPSILRRVAARLRSLEPDYGWGLYSFEALDERGEGLGRHFALDWFGWHFFVGTGRIKRIGALPAATDRDRAAARPLTKG